MRFQVTLHYTRSQQYDRKTNAYVTVMVRPRVGYGFDVVEEVADKHVVVSFEVKKGATGFGDLTAYPQVITVKNVDAVLELVAHLLDAAKVPNKYDLRVVSQLLSAKSWANVYDNYDVLDNQEGWGYMGGTGCGTLIHKLQFNKILGVLPALTGVQRTLAAMQFNGWLGEVKAIRAEHTHLRDTVTEDDLFVTLGAHPICQSTVAYVGARGFLVKTADEATCSCSKCAAKLGIAVASAKAIKAVAKTPDSIEHKGFRLTYSETTKAGPKSQVSGRSRLVNATGIRIESLTGAALPTIKTLNAELKERGQKLAYGDDPRGVRGLYYVEALKNVTGIEETKAVFLKTGSRTKDDMMATAKLVIDSNMLGA